MAIDIDGIVNVNNCIIVIFLFVVEISFDVDGYAVKC